MEPYVLHGGEGRVYRWHDVRVEIKAGSAAAIRRIPCCIASRDR